MSVAVVSADAVTARMLLLEAKRCGFCEKPLEEARVWLVDLDHPVKKKIRVAAPICIGFCMAPDALDDAERENFVAVLPVPFRVTELSAVLRQYLHAFALTSEEEMAHSKRLHFSKTENALLALLYENRDRVVTIEELSLLIGQSAENSNAVAVYLYRLRRKLEADGHRRIRTVRGVGYRWLGD